MIPLVLERHYADGGYMVVDPQTTLSGLPKELAERAEEREYLKAELAKSGFKIDSLVDELFRKNETSVRLSLPSDRSRGYVVDHDGQFQSYFEGEDELGWQRWYADHPDAHGHTRVSLPAFDEKSGLLLIYVGTQQHWEDGAGFLLLYKVENERVQEVWRRGLWIS